MSKLVDSVMSFLGRRSSKDQGNEAPVTKRPGRGKKAILKADSFVFLPGECTSSGTQFWGEVITPRTVGLPLSTISDDYSALGYGESASGRRKNVRSVLVDGSGKVVSRRLSGSVVSVKGRKSLDAVEDGSLEEFLKEFEAGGELAEADYYHTYARPNPKDLSSDPRYIYDRLVHLPRNTSAGQRPFMEEGEGGGGRRHSNLVLDLREGGRRRTSSGCSAEQYYAIPADQLLKEEAVDWEDLREQLKMATYRGTALAFQGPKWFYP